MSRKAGPMRSLRRPLLGFDDMTCIASFARKGVPGCDVLRICIDGRGGQSRCQRDRVARSFHGPYLACVIFHMWTTLSSQGVLQCFDSLTETAVFELFVRKLPPRRGFLMAAAAGPCPRKIAIVPANSKYLKFMDAHQARPDIRPSERRRQTAPDPTPKPLPVRDNQETRETLSPTLPMHRIGRHSDR